MMIRSNLIATLLLLLLGLGLVACEQQMDAQDTVHYQCDSGIDMNVSYYNGKTNEATFGYQGKEQTLFISRSASGAMYSNNQLVWWTKGSGTGSEGSLFRNKNGETGEKIESCRQV